MSENPHYPEIIYMNVKFTIGADPEFFLSLHGKPHSAIGLIGGTKHYPRPLEREGCAVQEDNVAVEFNVPPTDSVKTFIDNINYVMSQVKTDLNKINAGFQFEMSSALCFDKSQLDNPAALEFGCEPDFNAWSLSINPRPTCDDPTLRSAGGHIHVGTDLDKISVIRAMDLFLGVPSVKIDKGDLRRKLYGKAGAHRPKDYGVEYRTLSNFWIFSEKTINWAYKQTARALQFVNDGNTLSKHDGAFIQDCINNGDMKAYEHLNRTFGLEH